MKSWKSGLILVTPLLLFSIVLGMVGGRSQSAGEEGTTQLGFLGLGKKKQRTLQVREFSKGKRSLFSARRTYLANKSKRKSKPSFLVKTKVPRKDWRRSKPAEITVQKTRVRAFSSGKAKSLVAKNESKSTPKIERSTTRWKHLTPSVRRQIDSARPDRGRWKYIVVHNSGTRQGNAKAFDYYHRKVRGMRNGLAYHFVIGNGSYTGDGQIEVGNRWSRQINGGHLKSARDNNIAIGICLVGDFNNQSVRKTQLQSLDELVRYLEAKVGQTRVTTHKRINVVPTDCPGRHFPERWLLATYSHGKSTKFVAEVLNSDGQLPASRVLAFNDNASAPVFDPWARGFTFQAGSLRSGG